MRNENNIWYPVLEAVLSYLNEEKYPLVDTNLEVIRLVDNISEINPNIIGNTFVKSDNTIYDETSTIVQLLSVGDIFTREDERYFINEKYNSVKELGEQWNNTLIGDEGYRASMGAIYLDDSTFTCPEFKFAMREQDEVNMLETTGTDGNKFMNLDIMMQIAEEDVMKRDTGYKQSHEAQELISKLIYDFFTDVKCKNKYPIANRLVNWKGSTIFLSERKRPVVVSTIQSIITYR